jgi:hypothetical protein
MLITFDKTWTSGSFCVAADHAPFLAQCFKEVLPPTEIAALTVAYARDFSFRDDSDASIHFLSESVFWRVQAMQAVASIAKVRFNVLRCIQGLNAFEREFGVAAALCAYMFACGVNLVHKHPKKYWPGCRLNRKTTRLIQTFQLQRTDPSTVIGTVLADANFGCVFEPDFWQGSDNWDQSTDDMNESDVDTDQTDDDDGD